MLEELGFVVNHKKTTEPSQTGVFQGIVIDTVHITLELPAERIEDYYKDLLQLYYKEGTAPPSLSRLLNYSQSTLPGSFTNCACLVCSYTIRIRKPSIEFYKL